MTDQKYPNKYQQKHWGVPKINIISHGRSQLYDSRTTGDKISLSTSIHHIGMLQ